MAGFKSAENLIGEMEDPAPSKAGRSSPESSPALRSRQPDLVALERRDVKALRRRDRFDGVAGHEEGRLGQAVARVEGCAAKGARPEVRAAARGRLISAEGFQPASGP